ncbi:MAG: ROK family protein, partial [Solirubrobacteraceae bacterium]
MPIRTIHGGSPQALRESNKRLLLERLLEAPEGLTRPELARSLNLTVTAITNLVAGDGDSLAALIDEAPARTHSQRATNSGPVPKVVQLKPDLGYVIGIVLSYTRIELAFADLAGNFDPERDKHSEPWDVASDLHGALAYAATAANKLASARGVHPEELAAIGLSIAAPVNVSSGSDPHDRRGRVRFDVGFGAPPPWANIDPIAALTNHLAALPDGRRWSEVELHVDNDANLGALAERRLGAARGKQNILYIHVDESGLGAGLIFDGVNYRGAGGIAGELGHVVLEPDRPERCPRCGRPCVEVIVLRKLGCRRSGCADVTPLDQIVRASLNGDRDAIAAIEDAGDYLGRAIAPFVTLLNLDRVLIGGPFPAQAYRIVIPPIQAAVAPLAIAPAARDYVLELGTLQQDASLRGAIWLALERTRLDYLLHRAARRVPPAEPAEAVTKLARADAQA